MVATDCRVARWSIIAAIFETLAVSVTVIDSDGRAGRPMGRAGTK
jgi:hypothetical protein